ncbi:MAG: IS1595 family transposase [Proteobacteria bacterium]|nr:IS1595 family transposase [Pseudomonadota bacterium]MBI3496075.1 IS1595 family transposase [Pseudomonadota bacterium]
MAPILSAARFHTEEAAFEYVEALLWPTGPVCPHCGNADAARIGRLQGKTTRPGLRKCYECRKPFTVRMGTVFESSHAPLRTWLQAMHLLCSSKKGISTRQLHRTLGVSLKTAWFMGHRIREAMKPLPEASGPLGSGGKTVEADEMYLTNSPKTRKRADGQRRYMQVLSLVERDGETRSMFIDHSNMTSVRAGIYRHVSPEARLVTDAAAYHKGAPVAKHESVDHSKKEWVRGDVHTNTLEGFFSIFKRGMIGVYQHMDAKHLDRYLAEFDFRQNNRAKLGVDDAERTRRAIQGAKGKRLTYQTTGSQGA